MELTIILMFILIKGIYKYNLISIKISVTFYAEIQRTILKLLWNC